MSAHLLLMYCFTNILHQHSVDIALFLAYFLLTSLKRSKPARYIILLSDKTGFTASHVLSAAMYQFAAISEQTTIQVPILAFCKNSR